MSAPTIQDLINVFSLTPVYTTLTSLKRQIRVVEVDRPGLEMTGFYRYHQKLRLVVLGNKEFAYLKTMTSEAIYKAFLNICSEETPGLVVCHNIKEVPEEIVRVAKKRDCSILLSSEDTSAFEADVLNYLSEKLAPRTSLHADLMDIYGAGTVIMGDSGIGKSEIALDLIKRGHVLISDDKVDVLNVRGKLEGFSPEITYGMMEVRGIGLINVPHMFGINSVKRSTRIHYCLDLRNFNPEDRIDRIGDANQTVEYLGVKIPYAKLPVSPGRSMAEIVEVAVTNFKLKENGYDSVQEFMHKMDEEREKARKLQEEENQE